MADTSDHFVMATNNSSIVSKRSVERLYYTQPHFIRYFVKKPMRRSPVIHRGYWLRMRAVSEIVRLFLENPTNRPKVVLNLGCGADPLPFQFLSRDPAACKNVTFIDVDHHELMKKKTDIILSTPSLIDLLGEERHRPSPPQVLLGRKAYVSIGCDLRDSANLDIAVRSILGKEDTSILCLAEVSLAYMHARDADEIIRWAASLSTDVTFGLLEQILPDGPEHPFAQTMLQHFKKLKSPLRSVEFYLTLDSQRRRFNELGWIHTTVTSLWDLWSNSNFLSPAERSSLDCVEPFDEWEEFALFASHYFLLVASLTPLPPKILLYEKATDGTKRPTAVSSKSFDVQYKANPDRKGRRRYGASICIEYGAVLVQGGMGDKNRLATADTYLNSTSGRMPTRPLPAAARQCHTMTSVKMNEALLIGGRASPSAAMSDCWLLQNDDWRRVEDLPEARFRHMACAVQDGSTRGVLIFGGKTDQSTVTGDWLLWKVGQGWRRLNVLDQDPSARFGGTLLSLGLDHGLLFGGMNDEGVVLEDFWTWQILPGQQAIRISHAGVSSGAKPIDASRLYRFGATAHVIADEVAIIGGIGLKGCLTQNEEIVSIEFSRQDGFSLGNVVNAVAKSDLSNVLRPLFIGHCSFVGAGNQLVLLCGGAVCFSFGTFSNDGLWVFCEGSSGPGQDWTLKDGNGLNGREPATLIEDLAVSVNRREKPVSVSSKVLKAGGNDFRPMLQAAVPVVFRDVNLGECLQKWSMAYLTEAVGAARPVIVHRPQATDMNFQKKNFDYVKMNFGEFLRRIGGGEQLYLRSVSSDKPFQVPSRFSHDFPGLAEDFVLPSPLGFANEQCHSSVLRVSNTTMWLHYDTRANIFCSIRGSRKLILYPPSDVARLGFPPGASTSYLDIFEVGSTSPRFIAGTRPYETTLAPGDVLFIPPLWLHAGAPGANVSVAVNVFFNSFEHGYAASRDVYGNRDLQAYEIGRREVDKIVRAFHGLPSDIAQAYLGRLAVELQEKSDALTPRLQ